MRLKKDLLFAFIAAGFIFVSGCNEEQAIPKDLDSVLEDTLTESGTAASSRNEMPSIRIDPTPADEAGIGGSIVRIQNAESGLFLHAVGNTIGFSAEGNSKSLLWKPEKRGSNSYLLINLASGRTFEPGEGRSKPQPVEAELPRAGDPKQHWRIEPLENGWYRILPSSGKGVLTATQAAGRWQAVITAWKNKPGQRWKLTGTH